MAGHRLAVLVPALNEARTIAEVVNAARAYGSVIVIDNGSTDSTAVLAEASGARVLRLEQPGYDAALNAGFAHAERLGAARVLTMDADGQHDPADIPRFVDRLERGDAVVCGVRSGSKRIVEHLFAWICLRFWGIRDPWCGMKAYRMDVYRDHGAFDRCRSIGTELMLFAAQSARPVGELAIRVRTRGDRPRFGNRLQANLTLFGAMFRVLRRVHAAQ